MIKKIFGIKKDWLLLVAILIAIFIISQLVVSMFPGEAKECPILQGNPNAPLLIKYFESPYCIYCWIEEPILKDLLKRRGDLFALERYDIRYCHNETRKYRVSGTPFFVFSMENGTKEYAHPGFIKKANLETIICYQGGC